jgi:hypothetical protein
MPAVLGVAGAPFDLSERPPDLERPDCPPMPDRLEPPDIPRALDRVPGPAMLPVPDIPADLPVIPAPPLMPDARDDDAPGMLPIPDDAPSGPDMPDIPDRTPSPATPRGRVAGMLDIPLLPPIEPALGRFPGVIVPLPDGFADRGGPVDRSPILAIPPCCAQPGTATNARAMPNRKILDQCCTCRIAAPPTCRPAWSPRGVP